jgi:hypothetical protein
MIGERQKVEIVITEIEPEWVLERVMEERSSMGTHVTANTQPLL